MNNSGDPRYVTNAARMIWPTRRRRRNGSADTRDQSVRPAVNLSTEKRMRNPMIAAAGDTLKVTNAVEPAATTPQNASTTVAPSESPAGITTLDGRNSSNHGSGSSQRSLLAGPVGPLNAPRWRSPHRPSKGHPRERVVGVVDRIGEHARPRARSGQMDLRCRHSRTPRMHRVRGRPPRRSSWHGNQPRSRSAGDRRRVPVCPESHVARSPPSCCE